MITFGSVCSGVEAASLAWESLGFRANWFSEVEAFPSAVLSHRWPNVPNLGDMTELPALVRAGLVPAPRVLVGGTPCQSFSVAGLRKGMEDDRGQLTLSYVDLLDAIDEARPDGDEGVCVWENVPGVLSDNDNAFGCFLSALCGADFEIQPGEKPDVGKINDFWRWDKKHNVHRPKWPGAGRVLGPKRSIAWRVLDAQYFGVAQRRRRVFLVASARNGFDPGEILFESEGVRRDIAPSRETREEVASPPRAGVEGGHGDDERLAHPTLNQSHNTGGRGSSNQEVFSQRGSGLVGHKWPADVAPTLNAAFGDKQGLEDQHALGGGGLFVPVQTFQKMAIGVYSDNPTASTMCARDHKEATDLVTCFDSRQDPLIYGEKAGPLSSSLPQSNAIAIHDKTTRHAGATGKGSGNGLGIGKSGDPMFTLTTGDRHAVMPTMTAGGNTAESHSAPSGHFKENYITVSPDLRVRRLTPTECERLQGEPDGHTKVPYRGKPAEECPDGPRYKAIGNSKAVPCVQWLGQRLKNQLEKTS